MAGIEDKLDRYYDDVMGKVLQSIDLQQRILGEEKELKKEISRLRENIIQLEANVETLLAKAKTPAVIVPAEASQIPVAVPEAPAEEKKTPARTLKEYLAEGMSLYDVKVLNGFIKASKEVIKANCRKEPVFLKPRIEENVVLPVILVGKMKLARGKGQGSMALALEKKSMEKLTRDLMYMDDKDEISAAMGKDVTSELCNQICGRSKILLRGDGYDFNISVPEVISDSNPDRLFKGLGFPKVVLGFEYSKAPFYLFFWG